MADLFDQINKVWEGSDEITTKTKPESAYMTTRFLSLDPDGIIAAIELNKIGTLPPWVGLPFLKLATPNKRAPRNKYPKKLTAKKLSAKDKKALDRICEKFAVTEFHGAQIKQLLEAQGFKFQEN